MTADKNATSGQFEARDSHIANSSNNTWSHAASEIYGDFRDGFLLKKNNDKVAALVNASHAADAPQCYWDWAQTNFAILDKDKNGFINASEIDSGYRNPSIPRDQHYGLNGLRSFYFEIQKASNDEWFADDDGITRKDLDTYKSVQLHRNWIANRARRSEVDE